MASTASGVWIPGSDPTVVPASPIEALWNQLGISLNGMLWKYVASTTARAAFVDALTAEGYTIDASHPVVVIRGDAPSYAMVELTRDGTTWTPLITGDTQWVSATIDAAWNEASTIASRKIGPTVKVIGVAKPDSGDIGAGVTTGLIATLPAGHRPPRTVEAPITQWINGATPAKRGNAVGQVLTNGQVRVINGTGSDATGAIFEAFSFEVD